MTKLQRHLVVGTAIAVVLGIISGFVAVRMDGPFLLGFLAAFVLTGMVVMFVIAAAMESGRGPKV